MGSFRVAILYLDKQYMSVWIVGLQYHLKLFHVIQNNLTAFTLSLPDALSYITGALTTTTYVEPTPNVCEHIMYPQLFEELKIIL